MNEVNLTGRLTSDPRDSLASTTPVSTFRLAVTNGPDDTPMYISIATFGIVARTVTAYCRRGRLVAVSGRLRFHEWTAPDGARRTWHDVVADRVEFLDAPRADSDELAPTTEREPIPA